MVVVVVLAQGSSRAAVCRLRGRWDGRALASEYTRVQAMDRNRRGLGVFVILTKKPLAMILALTVVYASTGSFLDMVMSRPNTSW
jgi:hypothetical protein